MSGLPQSYNRMSDCQVKGIPVLPRRKSRSQNDIRKQNRFSHFEGCRGFAVVTDAPESRQLYLGWREEGLRKVYLAHI